MELLTGGAPITTVNRVTGSGTDCSVGCKQLNVT